LILSPDFYILRAMAKILVLVIGLAWASLLLISWGQADDSLALQVKPATVQSTAPVAPAAGVF
jgi:hypothetical protein